MADIVDRLRDRDNIVLAGLYHAVPVMREAADEIERLRRENDEWEKKFIALGQASLAAGLLRP